MAESRRTARSGRGSVEVSLEPPDTEPGAVESTTHPAEPDDAALSRSTWKWIRAAAIAVTLFVGWQLVLVLQGWIGALLTVVLFVVFGTVVAFAAAPLVRALERGRIPHVPAVLLSLLAVVAVVAGLLYLVAGPLAQEVTALASQGPALIASVQKRIADIQQALNAHGIAVGGGSGSSGGGLSTILGGGTTGMATHIGQIVIAGVTGVITMLVDTVIVLVTAFWLLNDGPALRRGFLGMLPGRWRDHAEFAIEATRVVIGGYVRAQLFLAAVIGTLAWIGCTILGVPFPIVVGVAAGVFELVPMLGPFLGGAVGVALALTRSPVLALWVIGLFVVIHVIEGYILAPRVQARFIQLHPLVAFLSLIAGIEVAGLLGALFAVPVASLGALFLRTTIGDWRAERPDLFHAGEQDPVLERRHRRILGEFRFFKRRPGQIVREHGPVAWVRRMRQARTS